MKIYINLKCHFKHVYLVNIHIFEPIMFYVIILQNKHLDLKKILKCMCLGLQKRKSELAK